VGNFSEQNWGDSDERRLSREVQNRTGLSLRRVLRTLKPLRSATVQINGVTATLPPTLSPDEEALLNALQVQTPRH
jgi:hypothetical protein